MLWTVCGLQPDLGHNRIARVDAGGVVRHNLLHEAGLHGDGAHGDSADAADDNALTPLGEVLLLTPPVEEAGGVIRPE